jgi:aminoglycoside phosphotransferase (APT) family kinase protein
LVPSLNGRLERLLRDLELSAPNGVPVVPCHGDFHARQLMSRADGLVVTDFDSMALAPPALDLATYAAHLVCGGAGDLDDARAVLEMLVDGYGGAPAALHWYLATSILRRSTQPFRRVDPTWPERVEAMAEAAELAAAP